MLPDMASGGVSVLGVECYASDTKLGSSDTVPHVSKLTTNSAIVSLRLILTKGFKQLALLFFQHENFFSSHASGAPKMTFRADQSEQDYSWYRRWLIRIIPPYISNSVTTRTRLVTDDLFLESHPGSLPGRLPDFCQTQIQTRPEAERDSPTVWPGPVVAPPVDALRIQSI